MTSILSPYLHFSRYHEIMISGYHDSPAILAKTTQGVALRRQRER